MQGSPRTVILRSCDGAGDPENKTFYIHWDQIFSDTTDTRFILQTHFRAVVDDLTTSEFSVVLVDAITPKMWDSRTNGSTNVVCLASSKQVKSVVFEGNTITSHICEEVPGSNVFTVSRPTECVVNVKINQYDGVNPENGVVSWTLVMNFFPI